MYKSTTQKVKEIRDQLKKQFPDSKFSVTKRHSNGVMIRIMAAPLDLVEGRESEGRSINHYYIKENYSGEVAEYLQRVSDIASSQVSRTFETADYGRQPDFYVNIEVGDFGKPFIFLKK